MLQSTVDSYIAQLISCYTKTDQHPRIHERIFYKIKNYKIASSMALWMTMLASPPLWSKVKHLNSQMDCHEILYRRLWPL